MTLVIMLMSFAQIVCGTPLTQAKNDKLRQARQMTKCDRKVRRIVVMTMRPVRAKKFFLRCKRSASWAELIGLDSSNPEADVGERC